MRAALTGTDSPTMARIDALTLDQMRILLAVVERGSFSAAGRALNRTQGAVSYNVATMEEAVGFAIFDRSQRTAALTDAGKVLVAEVRDVIRQFSKLQAKIQPLSEGVESEASCIFDYFFPVDALSDVARRFREKFPSVRLRVHSGILDQIERAVAESRSDFGVTNVALPPAEMVHEPLMNVSLLPVAAPDHPLAKAKGVISDERLAEHVQIAFPVDEDFLHHDYGMMSETPWRVDDNITRLSLLMNGLGWARVPYHMAHAELTRGSLVELHTDAALRREFSLFTIYRRSTPPGVAGMWLLEALRSACRNLPGS